MMNIPDDYNKGWDRCYKCGGQFHPAEQDCDCDNCEICGDKFAPEDLTDGACYPCAENEVRDA